MTEVYTYFFLSPQPYIVVVASLEYKNYSPLYYWGIKHKLQINIAKQTTCKLPKKPALCNMHMYLQSIVTSPNIRDDADLCRHSRLN